MGSFYDDLKPENVGSDVDDIVLQQKVDNGILLLDRMGFVVNKNQALAFAMDIIAGYRPFPQDALDDMNRVAIDKLRQPTPKQERVKSKKIGFVYMIQRADTNQFKIGYSSNVPNRLTAFGIALPFEVRLIASHRTDDSVETEAMWHKRFAGNRINGEWFALSEQEVAIFVANTPNKKTPSKRKEVAVIVSPLLQDENFLKKWEEFRLHRKQIKHPLTPLQEQKKLDGIVAKKTPIAYVIRQIDKAILKGWRDFDFPLEDNGTNGHAKAPQPATKTCRQCQFEWNPRETGSELCPKCYAKPEKISGTTQTATANH